MSVLPEPHLFFGSFRPNPVVTLEDTEYADTDLFETGEVTLSMTFGAENNTRELILVFLMASSSGPSNVEIDGISADFHGGNTDTTGGDNPDTCGVYMYSARVPNGTSGTVTFDFSSKNSGYILLYRASPLGNRTVFDTDTDDDDIVDFSINIDKGGFVIAAAVWTSTGSVSMSGVSEDYDSSGLGDQAASGHSESLAAETGKSITLDGPIIRAAGLAVSWRGNPGADL